MQFAARLVTGCVRRCGHRHGVAATPSADSVPASIGAVLGTLGGLQARSRLVARQRRARPAGRAGRGRRRRSAAASPSRPASRRLMAGDTQKFDADHRRRRPGRATAGGQADRGRADRRGDRTQAGRRHLRQLRLHPDQDTGGQRARGAHLARRGAEFGVGTGDVTVDMAKVKARKDNIMLDDRDGVESWLDGMDGCTLIRGHARFDSPHTIRVDGRAARGRPDLPQRRRPRGGAGHAGPGRYRLSDQRVDPRTRHGARASRHHRRQLHRAGVRADVPPIRRPRHA